MSSEWLAGSTLSELRDSNICVCHTEYPKKNTELFLKITSTVIPTPKNKASPGKFYEFECSLTHNICVRSWGSCANSRRLKKG